MEIKVSREVLLATIRKLETDLAVAKSQSEPYRVLGFTKHFKDDVHMWHIFSLGFFIGGIAISLYYEFFVL